MEYDFEAKPRACFGLSRLSKRLTQGVASESPALNQDTSDVYPPGHGQLPAKSRIIECGARRGRRRTRLVCPLTFRTCCHLGDCIGLAFRKDVPRSGLSIHCLRYPRLFRSVGIFLGADPSTGLDTGPWNLGGTGWDTHRTLVCICIGLLPTYVLGMTEH